MIEFAVQGILAGVAYGLLALLAIAMAMGRNPRVVLLDEPTQGLAPAVFDLLARTIERLRARQISALLAEQNVDSAAMVSDRYLALSNGGMRGGLRTSFATANTSRRCSSNKRLRPPSVQT